MKKDYVTAVRMSTKLAEQLKDIAASENRSLNGQIVHILQETVEAYKQSGLLKGEK